MDIHNLCSTRDHKSEMRRAINHTQSVSSIIPLIFFLLLATISWSHVMSQNTTTTRKAVVVDVGVVLNMQTWHGKMSLSCISMALSDLYSSHPHYNTRLLLHSRDSNQSVIGAAAAALDLIKNVKVQAIIGPATSMQANFVINLGYQAQVPIISFSASSPSLSSLRSPYFFRATLNDSYQVKPIASIIQAFGWRQAVPIYVDDEFGEGIVPYLIDALQDVGAKVPYRCAINPLATDNEIALELYKLMTMQTRVFIVHMLPPLGSRVFTKAEEIGMMKEGYVWIMSDAMTNLLNLMDPLVTNSMEGALGVKVHVPKRKRLQDFTNLWKEKSQKENITDVDLNIFGLLAYDTATALARAIEKVGGEDFSYQNMNNISKNSLDLQSFGVSRIGVDLCKNLETITFRGLAGEFDIINRELQPPAFQILNVVGSGVRTVGFWSSQNGLVKKLNDPGRVTYSTSKANLRSIIWPGDSTAPPKGWAIPANEKKLKIGVPVKEGFTQFVKVEYEGGTNASKVSGYCIDVFDAVMEALPYSVPYDFIPFPNATYNELVYQVRLGVFDAVVGDVTIVANRSRNVDFTLPYTESSVVLVVPFKHKHDNAWVFLKPLTWSLWLTSFIFFIFMAGVIWFLEHGGNKQFQGSAKDQTVTSLWFSFSTMVFQHKEKVESSLTKFLVIVWCFVVLILTQSYTASLSSMLTVRQLEPTITDVHELVKHGENVGHQQGSFVLALLKQLNFDESKIKVYNSMEELEDLLSKGTSKGGIAAAFDELPYAKVFLAKYCSKFTIAEPSFNADGFGFVFPMGSPLVSDVSRAILNVNEDEKMVGIENAWFAAPKKCPDPSSLKSESITLGSIWGLFVVVGVAASFASIIFIGMLIYENRLYLIGHIIKLPESEPSTATPSLHGDGTDQNPVVAQNQDGDGHDQAQGNVQVANDAGQEQTELVNVRRNPARPDGIEELNE